MMLISVICHKKYHAYLKMILLFALINYFFQEMYSLNAK